MTIRPQVYRAINGARPITHGVFCGEVFVCYSRSFCGAAWAINEINGGRSIASTVLHQAPEAAEALADLADEEDPGRARFRRDAWPRERVDRGRARRFSRLGAQFERLPGAGAGALKSPMQSPCPPRKNRL